MSVRLVKENFLYLQEINVSISEEKFQIYEYAPVSFTDVLLQRVVSVPHGDLGVATIGQRVVNTLPQCIPPPDVEACGSYCREPSRVPGRS